MRQRSEEILHLSITVLVGSYFYLLYNSFSSFIGSFIFGLLIDFDHFLDYFKAYGFNKFNLNNFLSCAYFKEKNKLYFIFHGFEYGFILIILGSIFNSYQGFFYYGGISLILHIIIDTYFNSSKIISYFIIYRIYKNFNYKEIILK